MSKEVNKMAKCPKCGKGIDHILAQTDASQEITVETHEPKWDIDHEWVTYCCPKCGEEIGVLSFNDAVEFMKGGE